MARLAMALTGTPASRTVLAAALGAVFLAALDLTVIATLLPAIIVDLAIPFNQFDQAAWIVTAYVLSYTVAIPVGGRLSDLVGRWPVLAAALGLFAAGSLLCALADSLGWLVAGRAVQAAGGGALVPVTMALAADLLPVSRRTAAIGLVGAVDTAGWVAGPLYGAAIVALTGDWRWAFWVNLPLAALAAAALAWANGVPAGATRPAHVAPRASAWRGGFDWLGAVFLAVGTIALNLALSLGGEPLSASSTLDATTATTASPIAALRWPLLAIGLTCLGALAFVERRARRPLIPPRLWAPVAFVAAGGVNLLLGSAMIVAMVNVPVLVNSVTPDTLAAQWRSAWLLAPLTVAMAGGSAVGGWLTGRVGARLVTIGGLLLAVVAFAWLARATVQTDLAALAWPLTLLGLGFGLVIASSAGIAVDTASMADRGIAAALVLVARLFGMAAGMSAVSAWALTELNRRLAMIARPEPRPGEDVAAYLARLAADLAARATDVAVQVLQETFLVAAALCVVALLPALWLAHASDAGSTAAGGR